MPLEYEDVITWCLLLTCVVRSHVLLEETVSMSETTAVLTGVARLPCYLESPTPDDKVVLVIWYKDGAKSPIYSLDVRGRSLEQATHWADERTLGGRSFFRVSEILGSSSDEEQAVLGTHLAVENVREADAGSYRCRVDFKHSPTRNSVVNLTVIVPPRSVSILDEHGVTVRSHYIGPYTEGSTPQITCIAFGGRPRPRVLWRHGGVLVDDSDETLTEHRVRNVLRLGHLERRHLHNVFTCEAINNNELSPVSSNVSIDMYLWPLDVRLLGENLPLSAGSKYEMACQTIGSRPPAHISWWKGGLLLDTSRETISPDSNVTTSTLTFIPVVEDLGKDLSCHVNNSHIADSAKEDTWKLIIHYSPIVSLELGSNLNGSSIREGVDVYFECTVRANPWIDRIIWRHNGVVLHNNASAGLILSNQTLVLQSVSRGISGLYTCVASNSEGDSESNPFNLDVKYEPVCSPGQQRVYGIARLEEVEVSCDVDANPPASLFRWSFNNSAVQSLEVGTVVSAPGGGRSIATYIPQAERDYGTLMCWGRNELGSQETPCVFHVVPAGKPDAPRNCAVVNRTATSLQVNCVRGFDGGLPQEFTLDLYVTSTPGTTEATPRRLVSNVTSRSKPEFTMTGLESGTDYLMTVYASNGKGRSRDVVTMKTNTLKSTQKEHRKTPTAATEYSSSPHIPPYLWVLAGIIGTLGILGMVLMAVFRLRGMRCDKCTSADDNHQSSASSPQTDLAKGLTVSLTTLKTPTAITADDTADNPDVVPHTSEADQPSMQYQNRSIGRLPRPVNVDSPAPTIVYGSIEGFSRSPNTESANYETPPVRWKQVIWRDVGTQSQERMQVLPAMVTASTTKLNAETQTPLLVRHKESAV